MSPSEDPPTTSTDEDAPEAVDEDVEPGDDTPDEERHQVEIAAERAEARREAARADDDGMSLTDIDAARFTRH